MKHNKLASLLALTFLISTASSCNSYEVVSNVISNDSALIDDNKKEEDSSDDNSIDDSNSNKNDKKENLIKRASSSEFIYEVNLTKNEVTLINSTNSNITSLEIPSLLTIDSKDYTITKIDDSAFSSLSNLTSVTIPASITYIGQKAFNNCLKLEKITISRLNKKYSSLDGIVYSKSMDQMVLCPNGYTGEVTIPRSVKTINANAFANCGGVSAIYLSSNVTYVGENAFYNCSSLTDITIPESVTSIGNGAFSKSGLTNIVLPKNLTSLGAYAFKDATKLKEIVLPVALKEIQYMTFYNCTSLTYVYLPTELQTISHNAFNGCTSLESLLIPAGLFNVGDSAFANMKSTFKLNLLSSHVPATWSKSYNPNNYKVNLNYRYTDTFTVNGLIYKNVDNGVMVVGKDKDNKSTEIVIPISIEYNGVNKKVLSIIDNCFENSNLTKVTFGDTITFLSSFENFGTHSFANSKNLKSVVFTYVTTNSTVTGKLTKINEYLFSGCTLLSDITFTSVNSLNSVTTIGEYAFDSTSIGNSMIINPISITSYESYAFDNCNNISGSIIVENDKSLNTFNSFAFNNCNKITEITFNNIIDFISPYAFENMDLLKGTIIGKTCDKYKSSSGLVYKKYENDKYSKLYYVTSAHKECLIFDNATDIEYGAFDNAKSITSFSFVSYNKNFFLENDNKILYKKNIDGSISLVKALSSLSGTVEINTKVDYIENGAFQGCDKITNLVFTDTGCTEIGAYAFKNCTSLKYVTLPYTLISIGTNAFEGCTSLVKPGLPDTITSLPSGLFKDCSSLSALTLPSSLTDIDDEVFTGCLSLNTISIPNSVVYISEDAFKGCDNLTNITLDDTNSTYYYLDGALYEAGYDESTQEKYPLRLMQILNSNRDSFILPKTVTSISESAFKSCTNLKTFAVENGNTTYSISNNALYEKNDGENTTTLVFVTSNITNLNIESNVKYIKDGALDLATSLTSIVVDKNNTVFSSDNGLLYNKEQTELLMVPCKKTGSIKIVDTVEIIATNSFKNVTGITSLTLPTNLKYVSDFEFKNQPITTLNNINNYTLTYLFNKFNFDNLSVVSLAGDVSRVSSNIFTGSKITKVTLLEGIENIESNAFKDCTSLTSVTLPTSLISIGEYAFNNCSKLTTVDFTKLTSLKTIGNNSFEGCSLINNLNISNTKITTIEKETFKNCHSLNNFVFPNNSELFTIKDLAFQNCNFVTVNLPSGLTKNSFAGLNYFPEDSEKHFAYVGNTSLEAYVISSSETLRTFGGVLYTDNKNYQSDNPYCEIVKYPYAKKGAFSMDVSINGYYSYLVNTNAFVNCTGITSFTNNKTMIYSTSAVGRFKTCPNLTSVTFNQQAFTQAFSEEFDVTKIKTIIFRHDYIPTGFLKNCTSVVSIDLSNTQLNGIGDEAFYGCTNLQFIGYDRDASSSYQRRLFGSLERVGARAFYNCKNLEYFLIGSNVVNNGLGNDAFTNCSNLRIYTDNSYYRSSTMTKTYSWCTSGIRLRSFNG